VAPDARSGSTTVALIDHEAAGRYVLGRRTADGGYCFSRTPEWGVGESNAPEALVAFESLRLLGVPAPAPEATDRWSRALHAPDGGYPNLTGGWAAVRALDLLGTDPDRSPGGWLRSWLPVMLDSGRTRDWRAALVNALRLLELVQLVGWSSKRTSAERPPDCLGHCRWRRQGLGAARRRS
jgi:hypothetical protein